MTKSRLTAEELCQLNTAKNAAIAYDGKVYDVTGFLDKHPGGSEQLLLAAGRDVTYLFNSYHSKETRKLVAQKCKYLGDLEETADSQPKYLEPDDFYTTLEKRVRAYFKRTKQDPKFNLETFSVWFVTFFLTLFLWYMTIFSVYNGYSLIVSSFLALASGFGAAIATFHAHDITHFACTHKPWVWEVMLYVYAILQGMSSHVWFHQHVLAHHVHPNHDRLDPDVGASRVDVWRVKPFQIQAVHYAYQYIYLPVIMNIYSIKMKVADFVDFFVRRDGFRINPHSTKQIFVFFSTKAIHFTYRIVIPALFIPWPYLLLINILAELTMGFWTGFVTQLNHLNTVALYPDPNVSRFNISWAQMQLLTTVDYATNSKFWNLMTGGLNSQAIHHLFPWILSVYYKELNPILAKTCEEFGVQYNSFDSIWSMWWSYDQFLKEMGQTEPEQDIKSKVF